MRKKHFSFLSAALTLALFMLAGCSGNFNISGGGEVGNPYCSSGPDGASYVDTVAKNVTGVKIRLDPDITVKFISSPDSSIDSSALSGSK